MPRRAASPPRPATRTTRSRRAGRATGRPTDNRFEPVAEPLHRNALHLLRLLRREDAAAGVSAARLSALSVLVFGGPCSLGTLAAAEQVSAPTMTRLAQELEREGWVRRHPDPADARTVRLEATPAAIRLLLDGRDRRLEALSRALAALDPAERRAVQRALAPLEHLVQALRDASPRQRPRSGRRRHD